MSHILFGASLINSGVPFLYTSHSKRSFRIKNRMAKY